MMQANGTTVPAPGEGVVMKQLTCVVLCLAALQLPAVTRAAQAKGEHPDIAAETGVHAALIALERQRANAIVRRDLAVLRQLMDRNYYHVESSGRVRSKTELLTTLERDDFGIRVFHIETAEVQMIGGGNAALVTGTLRMVQTATPSRTLRVRYARIWVRQPDGWKNTFHQSTEIKPPQDSCDCS
jgi:hypothetical protein